MDKVTLKAHLKKNAKISAFKELKTNLLMSKKIRHITYDSFELPPYLKSKVLCADEKKTSTALRSKRVRSVKINFKKMFKNRLNCPLQCDHKNPQQDSQEHLLKCSKLHQMSFPQNFTIMDSCADIVSQEII